MISARSLREALRALALTAERRGACHIPTRFEIEPGGKGVQAVTHIGAGRGNAHPWTLIPGIKPKEVSWDISFPEGARAARLLELRRTARNLLAPTISVPT